MKGQSVDDRERVVPVSSREVIRVEDDDDWKDGDDIVNQWWTSGDLVDTVGKLVPGDDDGEIGK